MTGLNLPVSYPICPYRLSQMCPTKGQVCPSCLCRRVCKAWVSLCTRMLKKTRHSEHSFYFWRLHSQGRAWLYIVRSFVQPSAHLFDVPRWLFTVHPWLPCCSPVDTGSGFMFICGHSFPPLCLSWSFWKSQCPFFCSPFWVLCGFTGSRTGEPVGFGGCFEIRPLMLPRRYLRLIVRFSVSCALGTQGHKYSQKYATARSRLCTRLRQQGKNALFCFLLLFKAST